MIKISNLEREGKNLIFMIKKYSIFMSRIYLNLYLEYNLKQVLSCKRYKKCIQIKPVNFKILIRIAKL